MTTGNSYHVLVIGGGLAGLSLSILLNRKGYSTALVEKDGYPMHRVCGEYVSNESVPFLLELGIDPDKLKLPRIRNAEVSSSDGQCIRQQHPMGGIGISRWLLDSALAEIASREGVSLFERTRVTGVTRSTEGFSVTADRRTFTAGLVAGSFGKRSNLDRHWNRPFAVAAKSPARNFIGVKYHLHGSFDDATVQLHLFPDGYAGLVRIEEGVYNFCYLTTARNLQRAGGSIEQLERDVLSLNPRIREIFDRSAKVQDKPVTISQISFQTKLPVEQDILMLGDAAGMVTPLCGNGMSMALRSGKIAFEEIDRYFSESLKMEVLFANYSSRWRKAFAVRLRRGRMVQRMLLRPRVAQALLWAGKQWPSLTRRIMRLTHGPVF